MTAFATVPDQHEAKRLLTARWTRACARLPLPWARRRGQAPAAFAFAGELLGDEPACVERTHPDLYVLEALGEFIRIDDVRALHHDLHMRPFEGDRRVYLVLDAHRLNDDAADALLKDLEEPPPTRRSCSSPTSSIPARDDPLALPARPFGRLSESAVAELGRRSCAPAPNREPDDRPRPRRGGEARSGRPPARPGGRRAACRADRGGARPLPRPEFEPADAAEAILAGAAQRGAAAKDREETGALEGRDLPAREAEQRVRRGAAGGRTRGAARIARGARSVVPRPGGRRGRSVGAVLHADRLDDLRADAARGLGEGRARGRALPRGLARGRGVQRQRLARARGALRPLSPRTRGTEEPKGPGYTRRPAPT